MAFTAQDVKTLREKTGVGMMECKKALAETDGDMDKAFEYLRERGLAAANKKASRIAAEGAIIAYTDDASKTTVLLEINSETDFVGKNEKFQEFGISVAKTIATEKPATVEALLAANLAGSDRTVEQNLHEMILTIGENLKIRRYEIIEGDVVTYIHGGGSVGVAVKFEADEAVSSKPEFVAMGKDVAMQVAAMSPMYTCAADVPDDVVAHEKEICMTQLKEDPKMASKPEQVLGKIIEGKIKKYFSEVCLADQAFVKDGDVTVAKYIENTAKTLGGSVKLVNFVRYAKGEGLEKREDNFADEVAGMMK